MLILRKEQMEVFSEASNKRWYKFLTKYVKDNFEDEISDKDDQTLKNMLTATVEKSQKYGLSSDRAIYKFVAVAMIYGVDFDENPDTIWMKDYLTDEEVQNPAERLHRLYEEILDRG